MEKVMISELKKTCGLFNETHVENILKKHSEHSIWEILWAGFLYLCTFTFLFILGIGFLCYTFRRNWLSEWIERAQQVFPKRRPSTSSVFYTYKNDCPNDRNDAP